MPEASEPLVQLAGSERAPLPGVAPAGRLDTSERAELTLVLRRRAEIPADIVEGPTVLTGDQLAERYGADPADVDLVRRTLAGLGLEITAVHPASRRIKVAGTLGQLSGVFGAELRQVSSPAPKGQGTVTHRYREGALFVPAPLDGVVLAVLDLDTRPQARPHFRAPRDGSAAAAAPSQTYPPNQVADLYQFPAGTTGAGQTIAVIELGGGFSSSDLDTYFAGLGIDVPTVTAASVDGGSNAPGSDPNGADMEVALDVDVIGAAAPGITVCVASGDNGSGNAVDDGQPHVDFPASSPHALACGGTKLLADAATGAISSEVVWNETAANEGAGGADQPAGGGVRPAVRPDPDAPVRRGGAGHRGIRLPRHHQREQRRLRGRPRLGRLLGPGQPRRQRAAESASELEGRSARPVFRISGRHV